MDIILLGIVAVCAASIGFYVGARVDKGVEQAERLAAENAALRDECKRLRQRLWKRRG